MAEAQKVHDEILLSLSPEEAEKIVGILGAVSLFHDDLSNIYFTLREEVENKYDVVDVFGTQIATALNLRERELNGV